MRRALSLIAAAAALTLGGNARADDVGTTLTLDDAIRLALQRNKVLKVANYGPGIARANLLVARGLFDPALVVNRDYATSQFTDSLGPIPVNDNTKTDTYGVSLQGLLPIGTQYSISGSTQEVRDSYNGVTKNYQTFGGVSVTQPLLSGFGFASNLLQVRIAKANRGISDQTYRQAAIDTVTNVLIAYSNLLLAHDEVNSARRAHDVANTLLVDNEKKFKIGSTSRSDVIEARAFAAQYDDQILSAERAVRDAQNRLRELIGDETFFEDEPLFTLAPMPLPDIAVDRHADLDRAYTMRPDYAIRRLQIVQNRASEASAANHLLPQVDFVGSYGYNGSSDTFALSRQMVQDHMNPSVTAGLTVTIPLTFAVGRGNLRSAKLQRLQSEEDLRRLAADIAVAVASADGQIETTRRRVAADEAAFTLAKQALEAEEKKNKAGTGSTLAVVQEQQQVVSVENTISFALSDERQAVAIYDQTIGTTLERYHVTLTAD